MKELMYPKGGGIIKNVLASLMLTKSSIGNEDKIDMCKVNSRVASETNNTFYNDSFVFQGSDIKGNLFLTRLGFRGDGKECDSWLWMRLGSKKFSSPANIVKETSTEKVEAGGLSYKSLEKGSWEICYDGPIEPGVNHCSVRLIYTPSTEMYCFGVHADRKTYALALAEMPWSREYFQTLESEKAERIEQGGSLKGKVTLDGKEYNLDLYGFRDHSWGKRNWKMIRRYIWNLFAMESPLSFGGHKYTHICFTTVHYVSFRHLVTGWIAGPDSVLPIVSSSDMHQIGQDGRAPSLYSVSFRPKGGPVFKADVDRYNETEHSWMIQNNSFEVNEAYCTLTINDIKGVGMSEFGYVRN